MSTTPNPGQGSAPVQTPKTGAGNHRNLDPDALQSAEKDEQITNIFYYIFFAILFLIALIILINCIISLCQHKIQEREEELLRNERIRQAQAQAGGGGAGGGNGGSQKKPCAPGGYVPGLSFQPRSTGKCKCKPALQQRFMVMPTRRDYINHLDTV